MIYGTVCSGIEAPTVAWHPLGWKPAFFSEIEKLPKAVLAHHYPGVPDLGDMTNMEVFDQYAGIDVLCGGTPCQSFSVAGLRKGLADPRGNLALVYLALVDRLRPTWFIWENVPGVLSSSSGRDFGAFLGAVGKLGYGFAYRVLDAQFFGVPQRRRRVFVVGCLGGWTRAAAVLFEPESLRGDSAPSRESGEGVAALTACGAGTCGASDNQVRAGHLVAHTLRGDGFDASEDGTGRGTPLVPCVSKTPLGKAPRIDEDTETLIPFDTTQITSAANRSSPRPGDPCHPIAAGAHAPAIAFHARQDPISGDVMMPLEAKGGQAVMAHDEAYDFAGVRRLTPVECERLQGFPDNYTRIPWRGKQAGDCPDGPRYKALGNSMAVPVVRWIGERIQMVSDLLAD